MLCLLRRPWTAYSLCFMDRVRRCWRPAADILDWTEPSDGQIESQPRADRRPCAALKRLEDARIDRQAVAGLSALRNCSPPGMSLGALSAPEDPRTFCSLLPGADRRWRAAAAFRKPVRASSWSDCGPALRGPPPPRLSGEPGSRQDRPSGGGQVVSLARLLPGAVLPARMCVQLGHI